MKMDRKSHCPVCASQNMRIVRKRCGFDIAGCADCHCEYAILDTDDLPSYDAHYEPGDLYEGYHAVASLAASGANEKVLLYWFQRRMLEMAGPGEGRLHMDVGGGLGTFMHVTQRHGWRVLGVDASRAAAVRAKEKFGIDTIVGSLEDVDLPDESVDWISAFEVLEHVLNPRSCVSACHRLLKPGGLITISVPNGQSRSERTSTDPLETPPTHVTFFSRRGLNCLLTNAGFEKLYDYVKPIAWGELRMARPVRILLLPLLVLDSLVLGNRGNRLLWAGRKRDGGQRTDEAKL